MLVIEMDDNVDFMLMYFIVGIGAFRMNAQGK